MPLNNFIEIMAWVSIVLPMVGATTYWSLLPHGKGRTIAEAFIAIAVAVLLAFVLGALIGAPSSTMYITMPFAIGTVVMGVGLNRALRKGRDADRSLRGSS